MVHGKVAVLIALVSGLDPPNDVLTFFDNPDGNVFLFPDNYMGPDLFCFVQDTKEMKELILLAVQAKVSPNLTSKTWISALNSITPDFFYTTVSIFIILVTCLSH